MCVLGGWGQCRSIEEESCSVCIEGITKKAQEKVNIIKEGTELEEYLNLFIFLPV